MADLTLRMGLDPAGNLAMTSNVVAGDSVFGHIIQARAGGYLQSLGQLHVNGRGYFSEFVRVGGALGIFYPTPSGNWMAFYGDWDWGGAGNIWARTDAAEWTDAHLGVASDERLKQDIRPSSFDCLASVLRWPLYQFRWKDSEAPPVPIGFVAQRQAEAFPESVTRGREEDAAWNIDTNAALAALTGAVQQLADRIDALEARHA